MAKHLIIFISFLFIFNGCLAVNSIEKFQTINKEVYIDVVEKIIIDETHIDRIYLGKTKKYLIEWFENGIKTNGFEGLLQIKLLSFSIEEKIIENGLAIYIDSNIELIIFKSALQSKKIITLKGNEFGELTGQFSLNDKTIEVNNIIKRLIEKFSIELSSQLN